MTKELSNVNARLFLILGLLAMTIAVYAQVGGHDFIRLDDPEYVFENPHLQGGLTAKNIAWSFAADLTHDTRHADYWQPVTFLSRLLDVSLFQFQPQGHHLMNLFYHLVNVLLVFWILNRWTGRRWESFFVAAFFAVHPLQVQAVAWVTARKDVLSSLFFLLALAAYAGPSKTTSRLRMILTAVFFAMSLLAKPMLITFPLLLILLDIWPLRRLQTDPVDRAAWKRSIVSKWPLLAIALAYLILAAASRTDQISRMSEEFRLLDIPLNYIWYLQKMVLPTYLAAFSPPKQEIVSLWFIVSSILFVLGLTVAVWRLKATKPYLLVGWAWFLIGLIPVIALRGRERAMYVPILGIAIAVIWLAADLVPRFRWRRQTFAASGAALIAVCMFLTWQHTASWKNSLTLFDRALDLNDQSYVAHNNKAIALAKEGRMDEAIYHYRQALKISPNIPALHNNLGVALIQMQDFDAAIDHFRRAIELDDEFAESHFNLGNTFLHLGQTREAQEQYAQVIRLDPQHRGVHLRMAEALSLLDDAEGAIKSYNRALEIRPDDGAAYAGLGHVYSKLGKTAPAIESFKQALEMNYEDARMLNQLGLIMGRIGETKAAILYCSKALRLDPTLVEAYGNLGLAYDMERDYDKAVTAYQKALELRPDSPELYNNLATTYARTKKYKEAIESAEKAVALKPEYYPAHNNLGHFYIENGNVEMARKHAEELKKLNQIKFAERIEKRIEKTQIT